MAGPVFIFQNSWDFAEKTLDGGGYEPRCTDGKIRAYEREGGAKVYIDSNTIITAASVVSALGVLGGVVAYVARIIQRDKRQSETIKAMQEEMTIICYGLRGALKGLIEQGCNGPCKDALDKLDKHLNKKAHTNTEV